MIKAMELIEPHLDVKKENLLGKSIDIFYKNPQEKICLLDGNSVSCKENLSFGPEMFEISISAIHNKKGEYVSALYSWKNITKQAKMVSDFEKEVKSIVVTVTEEAQKLTKNAMEVNQRIKNGTVLAADASNAATQTTSNVQSVASAAEELSASVLDISGQLQKTNSLVIQSSEKAKNVDSLVGALNNASNKVNEVVGMISNIASQINLLALNATIESARAGEAGKGFAVVANEVKTLANQTDKSVTEIQTVIEEMHRASSAISGALNDIKTSVSEISGATSHVSSAVEQQSEATNEIAKNMQTAAQGTQLISDNLDKVNTSSISAEASSEEMMFALNDLSKQATNLNSQVNSFLLKMKDL